MILLTNNQVGYEVFLTTQDLERIHTHELLEVFIYTHVKEDVLSLYGFKTTEHLDFFKQLISVSGVGPKSALNVLGLAELTELKKPLPPVTLAFTTGFRNR